MALNPERAKLLIAALRNGKYSQTTGRLKDSEGFCCLGVACDIYKNETGKGKWENNKFKTTIDVPEDASLPTAVQKWFGFRTLNGYNKTKGMTLNGIERLALSSMNDHGATFAQIADFIEQNMEGL